MRRRTGLALVVAITLPASISSQVRRPVNYFVPGVYDDVHYADVVLNSLPDVITSSVVVLVPERSAVSLVPERTVVKQ